jgi:hypothetical protein
MFAYTNRKWLDGMDPQLWEQGLEDCWTFLDLSLGAPEIELQQ